MHWIPGLESIAVSLGYKCLLFASAAYFGGALKKLGERSTDAIINKLKEWFNDSKELAENSERLSRQLEQLATEEIFSAIRETRAIIPEFELWSDKDVESALVKTLIESGYNPKLAAERAKRLLEAIRKHLE
jgi:hypothetical protein